MPAKVLNQADPQYDEQQSYALDDSAVLTKPRSGFYLNELLGRSNPPAPCLKHCRKTASRTIRELRASPSDAAGRLYREAAAKDAAEAVSSICDVPNEATPEANTCLLGPNTGIKPRRGAASA